MFKKSTLFTVIGGLLLLVSAQKLFIVRPGVIESITSYAVYPFVALQYRIVQPIKNWQLRKTVLRSACLLAEKYYLDREQLIAENIALHGVIAHYNDSKEITDFKERYNTKYAVEAQVLLKNFSNTSHFFLLDAGSRRGVKPDMVVAYKNCLIGRISEVYPFYSKAVLITDPTCKIAVRCASTQAQGIHEGINSLRETHLSFVSHLEKLSQGDMILSQGEGLVFPKGFGIGRVKKFELDGFTYKVSVEPLIDPSSISHCMIIQKGGEFKE